jgi:phthalate 4,5-dioxygenase oxygenase subunit
LLSSEENDLLTRIGPGTVGGDLLRRYWQPAALSEELKPGGAPLPVRLLGEDLVMFRDDQRRPGLLGVHCAHRGADLSYGRLEDGGLRCLYHGWLYDIHGRCLDQPGESPATRFLDKVRHPAYPCVERAGAIFAYLGPGEPPLFPNYEFLSAPPDHTFAIKLFSECNYLQGNEGNIDSVHLLFVHRQLTTDVSWQLPIGNTGWFDTIDTEDTEFGVRNYFVRNLDEDRKYVHISSFVMPNLSVFGGGRRNGYSVNWHVPIDDTHHWKYTFQFDRDEPIDHERARAGRTPMSDGYYLVPNRANRYLQDRESMSTETYSGISAGNFQAQDTCVTEGEGPIQDRSHEQLGYADKGVIAARKFLLTAIRTMRDGGEPPLVVRDPSANQFPGIVAASAVIPADQDHRTCWRVGRP